MISRKSKNKTKKPRLPAPAVVLRVYKLRNRKQLSEQIKENHGDNSSSLVNRKIQLHESSFNRLDSEAEKLGLSRSILQFYWDEEDAGLIIATVNDLESKIDELEKFIRPKTDEGYREAGRLTRSIRNHTKAIQEEVKESEV
jgi:predicted transcriptional regulator